MLINYLKTRKTKKQLTNVAHAFGLLANKDKFTFGKYCGLTVKAVLKKDPGYICWVHDNTSHKFTRDLITDARLAAAKVNLERAQHKPTYNTQEYDFDDLFALGMGMADDFH